MDARERDCPETAKLKTLLFWSVTYPWEHRAQAGVLLKAEILM